MMVAAVVPGVVLGFRIAVVAIAIALIIHDRNNAAMLYSGGFNPFSEVGAIITDVRSAATAATVAATTAREAQVALTEAEQALVADARQILGSPEMVKIRAAQAAGEQITTTINGRTIQYQPDLPWSAMTWHAQKGFTLGEEAFTSEAELTKTVLQELFRLANASQQAGKEIAAEETLAAYTFAEKTYNAVFK
jgi:hypothetical protein